MRTIFVVPEIKPTKLTTKAGAADEDGAPEVLCCLDPVNGEVHWSVARFGMATRIRDESVLLVMKTDGELVLFEATPEQYHELVRWQLTEGTTRALWALADGRYYVRDEDTMKCFDL